MKTAALLAGAIVLLVAPHLFNQYVIGVAVTAFAYTVAAAALNLVYGYTGLLSFAQLAFWGIGGYAAALTVMSFGGSFWLGLVYGAVLNALLAVAIGFPALRLNRDSFVIVTLSFSLLAFLVARDWVSLTKGPLGIPGIPAPKAFGYEFKSITSYYYLTLGYAVAALAIIYAIVSSRIGRTLRALKQNEPLATSQGIAPTPYKLFVLAVSAALTGIAGAFIVFYQKVVDPFIFDFYYLQAFLIMVIIGGSGTFWGVVIAGLVMSALPEVLRVPNELRMVIYGAILVAVVLLMPQGVAGWLRERRIAKLRGALQ